LRAPRIHRAWRTWPHGDGTLLVFELGLSNYGYEFVIAILTLPFIYLGHSLLERYLGLHVRP
jgi:hypothetical protein